MKEFLAFLESHGANFETAKMISIVSQYMKLDITNSKEDMLFKTTVDRLFICYYNKSLSELIEIFNSKSTPVIKSYVQDLENQNKELKEEVEELREAYWMLKHPSK